MLNNFFLLKISIALFAIFILKYLWSKRRYYYLSWKLSGPISLPFIGNGLYFFGPEDEIFEKCFKLAERYKSPIRLWFGPKFTIIITDVHQAEKIMSSMKFTKKGQVYEFIKPFNGEALISGSGSKWKRDRRLITPIFGKIKVSSYFSIILDQAKLLVKILDNETEKEAHFNVQKYLHRYAADVVYEILFGFKAEAQKGKLDDFLQAISRMYVVVHARIVKVWLQNDWLFKMSSFYKEHQQAKNLIHNTLGNDLHERKKQYKHNFQTKKCVVDDLLDIQDKVPNFATDIEIIHHLSTLFSASEDTICSICSFALVLLGMYPDIQVKVVNEIRQILGLDKENYVQEELVGKFQYLDMVIKEVLRLFPIAPFIMREAEQDFSLTAEITIPQGCSVIVAIHNIHRDPNHWERPNDFYPEHFLPEKVHKRHPFAFMPFSAGPRGCIGKGLANLAIKTTLITILQNFEVEANGKLSEIKLKADISVRTINDLYMIRLKRRSY